jgi:hypothetical protein
MEHQSPLRWIEINIQIWRDVQSKEVQSWVLGTKWLPYGAIFSKMASNTPTFGNFWTSFRIRDWFHYLSQKPFYSFERKQEVITSSLSFQDLDSYYNEPVLLEEIIVQVMGHKQVVSCEMLSCVPSECSPRPYCLMRTTLPSHQK